MSIKQHGYLVIADISGYTSFVAKTELEHSQEILTELMELMVSRFAPVMTISKLEGDAVFAYGSEEVFASSETLLDFIESIYTAFRDKKITIKRATTCTCNACRNIPSLDLKFFIHCGDFIQQTIGDTRELVGSDVNLVHRLTKNHVTEATGWQAYMLFTEQCVMHNGLKLPEAHVQKEKYASLGEVKTFNVDLHKRYDEISQARRIVLEEADADFILETDFPTPPAVTWEWMQDPGKRNQWSSGHEVWSTGERPGGRSGAGASNHCAHGNSVSTEVVVDWHPFEYYTTNSFQNQKHTSTETIFFKPLPNGGTRVLHTGRMHMPLPRFIRKAGAKYVLITRAHYDRMMDRAAKMAGEEFARNNGSGEITQEEPITPS